MLQSTHKPRGGYDSSDYFCKRVGRGNGSGAKDYGGGVGVGEGNIYYMNRWSEEQLDNVGGLVSVHEEWENPDYSDMLVSSRSKRTDYMKVG